jgi:hypothetical protein
MITTKSRGQSIVSSMNMWREWDGQSGKMLKYCVRVEREGYYPLFIKVVLGIT